MEQGARPMHLLRPGCIVRLAPSSGYAAALAGAPFPLSLFTTGSHPWLRYTASRGGSEASVPRPGSLAQTCLRRMAVDSHEQSRLGSMEMQNRWLNEEDEDEELSPIGNA